MFIFPVEMWLLLVLYLGYNLLQFLSPRNGDTVGYSAHLGGAAFGYLFKAGDLRLSRLEKLLPPQAPAPDRLAPSRGRRRRPRGRRLDRARPGRRAPPPPPGPSPTAVIPEEQFDEKLDEILVRRSPAKAGARLTEDENRVLDEASRRARQRRSERI